MSTLLIPQSSTGPKAHPRHAAVPQLPLPPGIRAKPNTPARMVRDVRTLVTFVKIFCKAKHADQPQVLVPGRVEELAGGPVQVCAQCAKLLQHAVVKRTHCQRDPKPDCKHCPTHCYAPQYRGQIRQVMMFSGRHLLLRGRLDYLWHLFF